jgi:alanine dehydrogenase
LILGVSPFGFGATWRLRRVLGRGSGLGLLLGGYLQDEISDINLVISGDLVVALDFAPIDIRPVGAVEIIDQNCAVLTVDTGVFFRDIPFWQHNVVALHPPDRHLGFVEFVI